MFLFDWLIKIIPWCNKAKLNQTWQKVSTGNWKVLYQFSRFCSDRTTNMGPILTGRSFTNFPDFLQIWLPWQFLFLIGCFKKFFFSELKHKSEWNHTWPEGSNWNFPIFLPQPILNDCFWLAYFKKGLFPWNLKAKWNQIWQQASLEVLLQNFVSLCLCLDFKYCY